MDNKDTLLLNEKITPISNNIHAFKKICASPAEAGMTHQLEVKSFLRKGKKFFFTGKDSTCSLVVLNGRSCILYDLNAGYFY